MARSKNRIRTAPPVPDLPAYLQHFVGLDQSDVPEDVRDVITAFSIAVSEKNTRSPDCALRIAQALEYGMPPFSPDIHLAELWYGYASAIGSTKATLRLLQKSNDRFEAVDMLNLLIEQLCKLRGIAAHSGDGHNMRMIAGRYAVEEHKNLTTKKLRAVLYLLDHFKSEEAADIRRKISEALGRTPKPQRKGPTHQVLQGRIQGDNEFKPGIYRVLEQPLELRQVPSDLDQIERTLDSEFPWFTDANRAVMRQLRIRQMAPDQALFLKPLLLVGLPGLGKTTWARRLAELLNLPARVVMAGGSADAMFLRGTSRGWSTARPGAVMETIAVEKVANPLIVVDEIDKASADSRNGRIWDVLLQLLEPASSRAFLDECLSIPSDISKVSWIATANSLQRLPEPLLNRFTVVLVRPPSKEDLLAVADSVRREMADELGMDPRMMAQLNGEEMELLLQCKDPREVSRLARHIYENGLLARKRRMH